MDDDMLWVFFAVMVAGQLTWLFAAHGAETWLRANDPSFEEPGFAARFFLGRLFTSFGPMSRYGELRRERGEDTTLVTVFWGGFGVSMLALVGLFAFLGSL